MAKKRKRKSDKKNQGRTSRKTRLSTRLTWGVVVIVVAVFIWVVVTPKQNGGDTSASRVGGQEQIARGKNLFAQNCAVCHGQQARGQDPANPGGGRTGEGIYIPPALNGTGHAWHHPADALFAIVKNGSPAPNSPMIGFEGRLGDEEIRDVVEYLFSLWPGRVPSRNR